MRSLTLLGVVAGGFLLTACSADPDSASLTAASVSGGHAQSPQTVRTHDHRLANRPDRGSLLSYGPGRALQRGAARWHAVSLSEDHALRAIVTGRMTMTAPDGRPIRLRYERHIEHPDGNWTWIGRPDGAGEGPEAVITFGEKAVFGSIPDSEGDRLQLTTSGGRSWLVEEDHRGLASVAAGREHDVDEALDFLAQPTLQQNSSRRVASAYAKLLEPEEPLPAATVDIVVGYTNGFAERLGGSSAAATRLTYLVDLANRAYANSNVKGTLRLVGTVEVQYPDATSNQSALFDLTGVSCFSSTSGGVRLPERGLSCVPAERPSSLQPLLEAREAYGADLVALVRKFEYPENQSCGIGWLLGAGQSPIDTEDADFAFSVISDSNGNQFPDETNTCREEMLAHETGHNMGLQHDELTAAGSDDTNSDGNPLDPEEYGYLPYSFGYSAGSDAGNFYTVMSARRPGQQGFLVFSNPNIACGAFPCGIAEKSDNAKALDVTMPLVASFRASLVPERGTGKRTDLNADGRSDIFWSNRTSQMADWWLMNGTSWTYGDGKSVASRYWVAGRGDFDGDGRGDILWEDGQQLWIWHGEATGGFTIQWLAAHPQNGWAIAGVGDLNGDGRDDIFWSNRTAGAADWWLMNGTSWTYGASKAVGSQYRVAGIGDFDGDGRDDVLWQDDASLWIWHREATDAFTVQFLGAHPQNGWSIAATGDLDGDGRDDIFWSNRTAGAADWWLMNGTTWTYGGGKSVVSQYHVVGLGDFDGDGRADVLWADPNELWIWHREAGNGFAIQPLSNLPAGWTPIL